MNLLSHDALLRTLQNQLRDSSKIHFREPNLNGWAMGGSYGSPDLLEVTKSYARFVRKVFEVKADNRDLARDVDSEKWTRYLPICDRLTFAVQEGCDYEKYLRPLPVGIMLYKGGKWRTLRAAPVNMKAEPWPENVWMALLFGRMGVKGDTRLERMDAEREALLSEDLKILRSQAHGKLSKLAQDLREKEDDLERRKRALDERDRATEADHRQRALEAICRKLGDYPYNIKDEGDIYRRWAQGILQRAGEEARKRLLEEVA